MLTKDHLEVKDRHNNSPNFIDFKSLCESYGALNALPRNCVYKKNYEGLRKAEDWNQRLAKAREARDAYFGVDATFKFENVSSFAD